jgi:hypothetical protein
MLLANKISGIGSTSVSSILSTPSGTTSYYWIQIDGLKGSINPRVYCIFWKWRYATKVLITLPSCCYFIGNEVGLWYLFKT